uniref:Type 4 prepilin peptidase bifunctional: Leader peptidase and N-methyltransferase transmembrane proteinT n=1 Tax=mine drainage metagenome TaxID=410659 RepID=E6QP27_9ZZZZ
MTEFRNLDFAFAAQVSLVFFTGLVFGSFLNVCRVRLPAGESIAWPGSHCPRCQRPLLWWQNLPLFSWLVLRGRCYGCREPISALYPLYELSIGLLWAGCAASVLSQAAPPSRGQLIQAVAMAVFCWLLVLLAALDGEHLWLPDALTLPAIALGLLYRLGLAWLAPQPVGPAAGALLRFAGLAPSPMAAVVLYVFSALAAAALVLVIRLGYWLVRRREGMGLGDAKLMAALGAWLGLGGALDAFFLAVLAATLTALFWLAWLIWIAARHKNRSWASLPLPLGTFLSIAALSEVFRPEWLWTLWSRIFLP